MHQSQEDNTTMDTRAGEQPPRVRRVLPWHRVAGAIAGLVLGWIIYGYAFSG